MNSQAVRLPCAVFLLLLAFAAGVCAQGEIRVGEFESLTGGNASFGISSHNGALLALDEINQAGGVLGKPLKLITEDDRSVAGEPARVVRKLIASDKVVALLGEVASSKSIEAAPVAQENKIPMLSPGATSPKVTETGDYIFRDGFIDSFQGSVMAKFALSKKFRRVALLTDEKQDHSTGLTRIFKENYLKAGEGEIVKEQSYSSGDKDFRAQLTSIKAASPDAIFLPGYYSEVSLIARQARRLGIKVPFMGGDGWIGNSLLPVAGNALDGSFFSGHCSMDDPNPVLQAFIKRYRAKFGTMPDDIAALGYDGLKMLADAIGRAGRADPKAIRDALAATKDFPGVTGTISIDEYRNPKKAAVVQTIADGRFQFVERVAP